MKTNEIAVILFLNAFKDWYNCARFQSLISYSHYSFFAIVYGLHLIERAVWIIYRYQCTALYHLSLIFMSFVFNIS